MVKKFSYTLLIIFSLSAFTIPQRENSVEKVRTIVVFFSLDVNLPAYSGFLQGLNEQFSEIDQPYNLIVEYMDLGRFSDENFIKNTMGLYNQKYEQVEIDLLITFGPGTFPTLKEYGFKALQESPVINIDIENNIPVIPAVPAPTGEMVLHISIKTDYRNTLATAFDLFPDNKDVYIISGNSPADKYFAELTRQASEGFKGSHNFHYFSEISLDSTLVLVKSIPQNSIVFVTSYLEDIEKIPFSTTMVVRIISASCKAPLFTLSDDFILGGAIGGYVYSFIEVGKQVANITEEVFNGKSINEFTIDEDGFNMYMYDWNQLKKWDLLDSKAIPSDSIIFNKEENVFIEYRWYILGGLIFLIGQSGLILLLIKLYKQQKAVARQSVENDQLFRELAREDRLSRISELTASLSHELNQPLTAILYNAQAGKRFLEKGNLDDKQAAEIFENIIEDDKRAGSLISSVRSLMKLETRDKEKVNLNSTIQETIRLFHSESIAKHIQITTQLNEVPAYVFGDKIQLQQVLLNLLFNAANALEDISPENKKIEIVQQLDSEFVTVFIRDSGIGIEESVKESLFKPFVTSREKGLGIGLAVSRSIIEAHNGVISAKNLPDNGAEFSFKLQLIND